MKNFLIPLCILLIFSIINSRESFAQKLHPTKNLPVIEFKSTDNHDYYIIFFTGNGGYRNLAQSITHFLNQNNISVLVINTKKYLLSEKKPFQISCDLETLIDRYNSKWKKNKVILIGYSMGAEVLPFAINCLEDKYAQKINDLILIAPWQKATFKVRLKDFYSAVDTGADIYTELLKMKTRKSYIICDDNAYSICHRNLEGVVDHDFLGGGHHFGGDYNKLSGLVGKRLNLE